MASLLPDLTTSPPIVHAADKRQRWWWVIAAGLLLAILFLHAWQIDAIPRGLYVDESSIGYNAALIAQTGLDEHHQFLPVFFEAFGEYKNSLYIYTAALIFKVLGVSVFGLRLTSLFYFLLLELGVVAFTHQVFEHKRLKPLLILFSILSIGTLPWFFSLSRISFEVISQPAVMIWVVYGLYQAYQAESRKQLVWAAGSGLVLGISLYSYSTARLLSFGFLTVFISLYYERKFWRRHAALLSGFILGALPFGWFTLTHPGALTARFGLLTYVYDPGLSLLQKMGTFCLYYLSYFDPWFLFITGDGNARHNAGGAGEIYLVIGMLAVIGIVWLGYQRPVKDHRFGWFLVLSLLGSPVAAALTEAHHSLRGALVGLYLLLMALYGLNAICQVQTRYWRNWLLAGAFGLLVLESGYYLWHYFAVYPAETVWAFESYDFPEALRLAQAQDPQQIIISNHSNQAYAHLDFYAMTLRSHSEIPATVSDPVAQPGTCIIYFASDQTIYDANNVQTSFSKDEGYSEVRCFK